MDTGLVVFGTSTDIAVVFGNHASVDCTFCLELSQTPPIQLHLKCPYFNPIEERIVSPAPSFPQLDQSHLLPFIQFFAQCCQSKGFL
jgi:hypothetical protein